MSDEDRQRWDARYAEGAYAQRNHPSALLANWQAMLPSGCALDIASGAGRNALFLAERGFEVWALDISSVALDRLRAVRNPLIHPVLCDLDAGLPPLPGKVEVIVKLRYLQLALMPALIERLAPGGVLICEVLLQEPATDVSVTRAGPKDGRFRAAPGALRAVAGDLDILHSYEGDIVDPDGRSVHVAQLVGRRG